jgi:hypothetical protein
MQYPLPSKKEVAISSLSMFKLLLGAEGRESETIFCGGVEDVVFPPNPPKLDMRDFKKLPLDDLPEELVSGPVSGVSDEE